MGISKLIKANSSGKPTRPLLLVVALCIGALVAGYFASVPPKGASAPRSYSIGDFAAEDVVAPRKLSWFDPLETEARRQRELSKGPVLFRVDPAVATRAVTRFNEEVASTRASFMESMEKLFNTRTLDSKQVESPLFRQLVIDFRREHPRLPITVVKAARWAQGDYEEKIQQQFSAKLRAASQKWVHADAWPAEAHGDHLRIVTHESLSNSPVNLLERSQAVRRTNIVAISKVREMLQAQLPREQHATAKYLAGFIEVNCEFDPDLTLQLRQQRADSIRVVHVFEEGQSIVRRGEKVDAKIKFALDSLNVRSPSATLPVNRPRQIWLWSTSIFCVAMAIFVLLRRAVRPGHPLVSARNVVLLPQPDRAGQMLEAKLMPHLARALMNKLVRGLISQRAKLLTAQTDGTEQLNELEQQLEQISTRLHARQAVYEKRIAELECDLAAAEEENRELIRAKIREARENLERARAQAARP